MKVKHNILERRKYSGIYLLLPLAIILAIVPLIVYLKIDTLSKIEIQNWKGKDTAADFFSYYKAMWLIILSSIGLIMMLYKVYLKEITIRKSRYYIPMGIYFVFIIISSVFSEYRNVAFFGFVERYEGMFVLLSYLIIIFIAMNLVNNEKQLKFIIGSLVFSSSIIGIIGIFQYIGYDILKTSFGKSLILPAKYSSVANNMNFTFGKNTIYATLYNTNYVGSFMAMLLPISLGMIFWIKNRNYKILSVAFSLLMLLNLVGSNSRAGLVGAIVGLLFFIILMRKKIFSDFKKVSIVTVILLIAIIAMNIVSNGRVINRINLLKDNIFELFSESEKTNNELHIDDILFNNNVAEIKTNKENIKILSKNGNINFLTENDKKIPIQINGSEIILKDEKYSLFKFELLAEKGWLIAKIDRYSISFYVTKDGLRLISSKGQPIVTQEVKSWGFEGKEKLGSSRGYIWSRTIPMLKETIIKGFGPDTFPIYFPQDDYVGKLNSFGDPYKIVDKPHNLFLQIGTGTGVISLISVLGLFIMYLISSLKLYFTINNFEATEVIGISISSAFIGYVIAAFFNDSLVSVAPVFWILLGVGISINHKLTNLKEI